jgi:hypothetical protein
MMKKNDCKIKGCFCKCETKKEFQNHCFNAIKGVVYNNKDDATKCAMIQHIVESYGEMVGDYDG